VAQLRQEASRIDQAIAALEGPYGWLAFRRGLAGNLSELGVPDPVIQQVLRHGDVGTTARFYRKTRRPAVTKAMKSTPSGRQLLATPTIANLCWTNIGQTFLIAFKVIDLNTEAKGVR
jgi:hypothetical protein